MLISYPHWYPQIGVAGRRFTGERGSVPTRDYDELGKAGEREKRRINYDFRRLERPSVNPACTFTLGGLFIKIIL